MKQGDFDKKTRTFKDTRGKCWYNVIPEMPGQLDFKVDYPGTIRAFHFHEEKTEWFVCISGNAKFYLTNPEEIIYLSQGETIKITPRRWHGYQILGNQECILLEYEGGKYGVDAPDDKRAPFDKFHKWEKEKK